MSTQSRVLRSGQQRLLRRSAELRNDLVSQSAALKAPLAQVDRVQRGLGWLRRHPLGVATLAIAALALKPRNALSKISRAWTLWTLVSRFLR